MALAVSVVSQVRFLGEDKMRKSGTASVLLLLLTSTLSAQSWRGSEVIAIEVNDSKGRSIADARVTLTFQGISDETGPPIVATDTKGRAVLVDLAPGPWQVEVDHPDYLSYVAMIDVRRGKKPLVSASFLEAGGRSLSPVRVKFSKGDPGQASPVLEARQPVVPTTTEPRSEPVVKAESGAPAPPVVQAEPMEPQPEASATEEEVPVAPAEPEPEVERQVEEEPVLVETPPPAPSPVDDSPSPEEISKSPESMPVATEPAEVPDLTEDVAEVDAPAPIEPSPIAEVESTPDPSMDPVNQQEPVSPEPSINEPQTVPDPAPAPPEPVPALIEEPVAAPEQEAPITPPVTPEPVAVEEEPPVLESELQSEIETAPQVPAAEPVAQQPVAPAPPLPAEGALPVPPDPGIMVNSSGDGSCSDCQTAEWSLTTSAPVAAAAPGSPGTCGAEVMEAARTAMEGLSNSIQLELESFIGPAADGSSRQAIDRIESDLAEPFQSSLAGYVAGASPCQIVGVVIPKSLRFSRVRLSATGQQGASECRPGQECPIGEARWVGSAQVARGYSVTVVYGVFQNLATDRGRRAGMTVYFRPPNSNWRPRIPAGP